MTTEHPILFSAPMVRAILEGRKTQTRRVWKQPKSLVLKGDYLYDDEHAAKDGYIPITRDEVICPYGRKGDKLWVRETTCKTLGGFIYRATDDRLPPHHSWTPSIHMPRAACRLVLEITDVRVERLHDITSDDAKAEGVPENMTYVPVQVGQEAMEALKAGGHTRFLERIVNPTITQDWREGFFRLWKSINGEKSLAEDPWVWVIEFERIIK